MTSLLLTRDDTFKGAETRGATLKEGHPTATQLDFSAVYEAWLQPVTGWIRAFGGLEVDYEDVAQEVFLVVRRKLGRFDGENLGGWLYRITQLTVRDYRRRAWFRRLVFGRDEGVARTDRRSARGHGPARAPGRAAAAGPRARQDGRASSDGLHPV